MSKDKPRPEPKPAPSASSLPLHSVMNSTLSWDQYFGKVFPYPMQNYAPGFIPPDSDHPDFFSPYEKQMGAPFGVEESDPTIAARSPPNSALLRALLGLDKGSA